jgi:hypothetical protein
MRLSAIAGLACILAAALVSAPAAAQQAKTVADVTIRYGLVTAKEAAKREHQHGSHWGVRLSGMEHLVVTVEDARTGRHIAGARVVVELRDPKGKVQTKTLEGMVTQGFADYGEVFNFGWSGKYTIRVKCLLDGANKPVEARFVHRHFI